MHEALPKVSIGVPTYRRPDTLRRALQSVAQQHYPNIEVIVGDNNAGSAESECVTDEFRDVIADLRYQRHETNIGGSENFMFCLAAARGKYFMWLADDDEIYGQRYIESLVQILEENPDVATAAARWKLLRSPTEGEIQAAKSYESKFWLLRAVSYVWKADDDFFYGLHRAEVLREARLPNYWAINASTSSNLTYTYLIDIVLRGRVVRAHGDGCLWINHAYTAKDHTKDNGGRSVDVAYVLKRLNVHWLYLSKVRQRGGIFAALVLAPVCVASLAAESFRIIRTYTAVRLARLRKSANK